MTRPDFPTMQQVEAASHEQLARWYRFLPMGLENDQMQKIADRIEERLNQMGGITPELDQKLGW
jgi:chemotaxis regulatin CheY-phosphate phosphatase CheZ